MLINSYQFGKPAGSNNIVVRQISQPFVLDNTSGNTSNFVMTGVQAGSYLVVVVNHMMLNGNNDSSIVSQNTDGNSLISQAKSIGGTAGGSAHKGSAQIHKSPIPIDFGGPASGDVTIFMKSTDANIANIRMQYVGMEITNIAAGSIVVGTDSFATNIATNAGNSSPNVWISGFSNQNCILIATATGLQANQFSFNTSPYPATGWTGIYNKNEASGTATGNTRGIANYKIVTTNVGTFVSDWTSSYNSAPWAALVVAFSAT